MALLVGMLLGGGCSSLQNWRPRHRWLADYEKAENRSLETGQDLLIYFHSSDPKRSKVTDVSLAATGVRDRLDSFVRTTLVKSYEPDRRYVAQFGVLRAPALIIVRTDGTYHSQTGEFTEEQILSFVEQAKASGSLPRLDPYVPRRAPSRWHDDVGPALAEAASRNTPTFVVYYRSWSRDWSKIKNLLNRHEVASRLCGLVHCRIGTKNPVGKAYITPFGALALPALVLARPDGTFTALETPTSYESIVRFLDSQAKSSRPHESITISKELDSPAKQNNIGSGKNIKAGHAPQGSVSGTDR